MENELPQSLKGWLSDTKNKEKIKVSVEHRAKKASDYVPQLWGDAVKKFNSMSFPQELFDRFCHKVPISNYHTFKRGKAHPLSTFKWSGGFVGGFQIVWTLGRCDKCKEDVIKKGVLFNRFDCVCHIKNFVKSNIDEIDSYVKF